MALIYSIDSRRKRDRISVGKSAKGEIVFFGASPLPSNNRYHKVLEDQNVIMNLRRALERAYRRFGLAEAELMVSEMQTRVWKSCEEL